MDVYREEPVETAEEVKSVTGDSDAQIFDLIEQGFWYKERGNLPEAVACFELAWDITIDDELKRNLGIELLNIFGSFEEN